MKLAMLGPVGLAVILQRISAETSPQLPQVPKVFNAGPDGMPQLPHVEELLKDYQEVKQHLESETSSLTEHLSQVEMSGLDEIGKQKELFDQKLREQEKENAGLVRSNSHLAKEIIAARQENAKMKKEVAHKEKLMSFRQNQVRGLEQQLVRSQKFFQQVMNDTAFNKPGEAVKLEDEAELPELDAVSFLEVSKRSHKAKKSLRSQLPPDAELVLEAADEKAKRTMDESEEVVSASKEDEQIIASLTQDLQKLRKAQVHSRKRLKTSFDQSFEAGKRRQEALKKQESVLTEELKSTQAAGQQLQAESHKLQSALDQMESKLKRGGNLFGKLQQVASAPAQMEKASPFDTVGRMYQDDYPPKGKGKDGKGKKGKNKSKGKYDDYDEPKGKGKSSKGKGKSKSKCYATWPEPTPGQKIMALVGAGKMEEETWFHSWPAQWEDRSYGKSKGKGKGKSSRQWDSQQ